MLVLWRGTPGWFLGSRHTTNSSLGSNTFSATAAFGKTTLHVEFSRLSRLATLNGVAVTLGDNNVVLVDDVDSGEKIAIAGLVTIRDPMVNQSVASVIAKGPRAVEYLRCDVQLPEENARRLMDHLCSPYR